MNENDYHESNGVVVPYVGIDRIIDLLSTMHTHKSKEKSIVELASLLGCTRSNLNNVTPALGILNLANVKKGILILTMDGLRFADKCTSDPERAKQIVKKNISNSKALNFTKSLLETRSSISGDEIGRALAERYKKNWKDIRTYRNFGNSCASILSYAGIGYFYDGVFSLKPPTIKSSATIYAPAIGYNPILKILTFLHGFERAKVDDISKKLQLNENSVYTNLTICTTLKLIQKETANVYSLTSIGRQLIDPTVTQEEKVVVFRRSLINSPYVGIIQKLAQHGKEMTYDSIGDVIAFYLKSNWSTKTKKTFAKKFITWLNSAGLIEKVNPGVYSFRMDLGKEIESIKTDSDMKINQTPIDIKSIYEVGRAIGSLESVLIDGEKSSFFNERLVLLKGLLSKYEDLRTALDMLAKNFELALSSNNPSIYKSNLDFIREKIKEKMMTEVSK